MRIEVRSRLGRVVDRQTVDNDERLVIADDRADAADLNEGGRAGVPRLRANEHVWRLRSERFHDVLLVALDDLVRSDAVPHVPEFLGRGTRARPRDYDFTELQRIGDEGEILLNDAGAQGDLYGGRLVAEPARNECDRLSRLGARAGNHNRIAAIIPRGRSEPERWDNDLGVPDRSTRRGHSTA